MDIEPDTEGWLTPAEVAAQVRVSDATVRNAIAQGRLTAYKVAGRVKIKPVDVAEWRSPSPITITQIEATR